MNNTRFDTFNLEQLLYMTLHKDLKRSNSIKFYFYMLEDYILYTYNILTLPLVL